eukprot:182327-Chlamydomonas_euryale.AAC.1
MHARAYGCIYAHEVGATACQQFLTSAAPLPASERVQLASAPGAVAASRDGEGGRGATAPPPFVAAGCALRQRPVTLPCGPPVDRETGSRRLALAPGGSGHGSASATVELRYALRQQCLRSYFSRPGDPRCGGATAGAGTFGPTTPDARSALLQERWATRSVCPGLCMQPGSGTCSARGFSLQEGGPSGASA